MTVDCARACRHDLNLSHNLKPTLKSLPYPSPRMNLTFVLNRSLLCIDRNPTPNSNPSPSTSILIPSLPRIAGHAGDHR